MARARDAPWSNNQYLADLLPNSEIHPLDAGHFAWEQAPDEYGRLVTDWVTDAGGVLVQRSGPLSPRGDGSPRGGSSFASTTT